MTEKEIKSLIDKLNKDKNNKNFFIRPLSNNVDFVKVLRDNIKTMGTAYLCLTNIYFIKNEEYIYVAAVVDMGYQDLHFYVLPKFRKKGYLTKALKDVVLNHLSQKREEQKITIESGNKPAEKVAAGLGFTFLSSEGCINTYVMNLSEDNYIEGINTEISKNEMVEIKQKFNYISNQLMLLQAEIEMKLGESEYTEDLKTLQSEIYSEVWKFEDYWYETKQK